MIGDGDALVARARELATTAHAGQRYGDRPYTAHLEHVEEVVRRFPHTPVMRAAAWLHDSVEDTSLTLEEVAAAVGDEVAAIVAAVTDQPGANRAERKARTLPALAAASPEARAVKLADRIANLEASRATGRADLLAMYRREQAELRRQLARPGEHEAQWALLESLLA